MYIADACLRIGLLDEVEMRYLLTSVSKSYFKAVKLFKRVLFESSKHCGKGSGAIFDFGIAVNLGGGITGVGPILGSPEEKVLFKTSDTSRAAATDVKAATVNAAEAATMF